MGHLYASGWRQGTLLRAELQLTCLVLQDGAAHQESVAHGEWLVVTQDCDLAGISAGSVEPTIELRPVYHEDPPVDWGIRSARLLLQKEPPRYLVSTSPRTHVAPALMSVLIDGGGERTEILDDARRVALKTWLGLRYDRPAVPDKLVPLASRIAEEVHRLRREPVSTRVRDILMQFDTSQEPPRFSLYAVLENLNDRDLARELLARVAQRVPTELGIGDILEAAPATGISLHLVETSYAADVTQITWGPAEPRGAY